LFPVGVGGGALTGARGWLHRVYLRVATEGAISKLAHEPLGKTGAFFLPPGKGTGKRKKKKKKEKKKQRTIFCGGRFTGWGSEGPKIFLSGRLGTPPGQARKLCCFSGHNSGRPHIIVNWGRGGRAGGP